VSSNLTQTAIDDVQNVTQKYSQSNVYHNWKEVNTEMVTAYNNLFKERTLLAVDYNPTPTDQTVSTTLLLTGISFFSFLSSLLTGVVIGKLRYRRFST